MKTIARAALVMTVGIATSASATETTPPKPAATTTTEPPPDPPKDPPPVDPPPPGYGDLGEQEYDPPVATTPPNPTGPGVPLSDRVDLGPGAPAPTEAPKAKRASPEDVERGMDGARRSDDSALGFGNREEGIVAAAVRQVLRSAPVPDKTRARVVVDIDATGAIKSVAVVTSTDGTGSMWAEQAAKINGELGGRVELSPTAMKGGVQVVVDAKVVHVFSNGTDGKPMVGECPKMPDVLNDQHPAPFGAIGGAPYLEFDNGTCNLQDVQGTKKHIEVKTNVCSHLPNIGPPPFGTLDAKKPKKQRPTLGDMLFGRPPKKRDM